MIFAHFAPSRVSRLGVEAPGPLCWKGQPGQALGKPPKAELGLFGAPGSTGGRRRVGKPLQPGMGWDQIKPMENGLELQLLSQTEITRTWADPEW